MANADPATSSFVGLNHETVASTTIGTNGGTPSTALIIDYGTLPGDCPVCTKLGLRIVACALVWCCSQWLEQGLEIRHCVRVLGRPSIQVRLQWLCLACTC